MKNCPLNSSGELARLCVSDGPKGHPGVSAVTSPQTLGRWHNALTSAPKCSDPALVQSRGGSGHSIVATSSFPPFGKFYIFEYCHLLANRATNKCALITPVIKAGFGRRLFYFNAKGLDETPHQSHPWALSITIYYPQK